MTKKKLIFILILFIPASLWSEKNYYFEDITQSYNLSNMGFSTICEDDNGFIWCGGQNGLFYHNTVTIDKLKLDNKKNKNTIPNKVQKVYKDLNSTIWVCTQNGLYKHHRKESFFEQIELKDTKTNNTQEQDVNNIVQLNEHEYLLHRHQKILIYNTQNNTVKNSNEKLNKHIIYINRDKNGLIHIATQDGKIYELQNHLKNIKLLYDSPNGYITSICKDGNKYYIGYRNKGVKVINLNGIIIEEFNTKNQGNRHINNNIIRKIIRRKNGEIWVATVEGIYVLYNDKLTLLDSQLETGLPHRWIYDMHQGLDDKIWVSTYAGGVACYSEFNYKFKYIHLDNPQWQLDKSHVSTVCEDSRGYIWVGSEDEGSIKIYSTKDKMFIQELPDKVLSKAKNVKSIVNISNELIAFGINASNTITLYNYKKGIVERQINLPLKKHQGVRGALYNNGILWVNDQSIIVAYDINAQKIKSITKSKVRIWQLYIDSSHKLWVCTSKGLYALNPEKNTLEQYHSNDANGLLNNASIYSVCEDRNGTLWVGTTGQGLYLYHPENQELSLAPDHQLSTNDDIYNIINDHYNNIWYITNKGLYRYDYDKQSTDYYGTNNNTLNAENRLDASCISSTGKLYFGEKSGFTIIDPTSIKKNTTVPSLFLANFKVNNIPYRKDSSCTQNALTMSQLRNITLKAKENTLSFKVVSNNFIKSESNKYRYRLTNYDDNWVEITQNRDIIFTKVPPGKYVFEAYGSNNDMVWSKTPYRLNINILYPVFIRWYALLTYFILLVTIGWWVYKELNTKLKLRKEIEEARNKSKVSELIHAERIKLFTNISHELRTPLSLIVSPIKHILQENNIDPETKQLLQVVDRNTKRLQRIADQTIDFRLLEVGKLKPNLKKHELIQLTKDVFLCFEQLFIDREIKSDFKSDFKKLELIIDDDMVEKIIYNLLSNALKYTFEKESISLHISQHNITDSDYNTSTLTGLRFVGQAVSIIIKDTGPGIKKELLPHIFERFAKGDGTHQTSTGIGLHLCKEYSKLNRGNIQLITKEGDGATFILNLPITEDSHFEKSELKQLVKFDITKEATTEAFQTNKLSNTASILLIEDNGELRDFLKTTLASHYKIITAKNGEQAITQLQDITPNLILTDVAMPGMSGIELTKQLKQNQKYSHIPIIVMTAYADRSYQMESILNGADAFFTKPIDLPLLLAQIHNSLTNKKKENTKQENPHQIIYENDFIEKARKIVVNNLQNPDFQIPDLLQSLNTSKSTLSRKLKAETQQNISCFIRDIRLTNAQNLLFNGQFNIDEIATFVGFNYTSYFIKSFKNKYGLTPSEYRKQIKKKS